MDTELDINGNIAVGGVQRAAGVRGYRGLISAGFLRTKCLESCYQAVYCGRRLD